jgi:Fe-S cluster assembly iron-binding protein IscA
MLAIFCGLMSAVAQTTSTASNTLLATGFTLHNPNVKKSCACGASFSV